MNAKFANEKFNIVDQILSTTQECERITSQIYELQRKLSDKRTELRNMTFTLDSILTQEVEDEVAIAKQIQAYEEMAAEMSSPEIRSWDEFMKNFEVH